MEIRYATDADIPAIVDLLKASLGETLMPKSEQYWRWKHLDNPFGASPVLLAWDGQTLAGVRAFMPWTWRSGNQLVRAIRAVDTATHPQYQGKGIFKKLTLGLLETCREQGREFIFNTPNGNSRPGYLKMGWEDVGKLPVHIYLLKPFGMLASIAGVQASASVENNDDNSIERYLRHQDFAGLLERSRARHSDHMHTDYSVASVKWRYTDVPVVKYHAGGVTDNTKLQAVFFYRLKPSRLGTEFRITDLYSDGEKISRELYTAILERAKAHRAHYITISGLTANFNPGVFTLKKLSIGPIVTVRKLNEPSVVIPRNFSCWDPSLGDLELF